MQIGILIETEVMIKTNDMIVITIMTIGNNQDSPIMKTTDGYRRLHLLRETTIATRDHLVK